MSKPPHPRHCVAALQVMQVAEQLAIDAIDDTMLNNMMAFAKEVAGTEEHLTLAGFTKLCAALFGQPA